MHVMLTKPAVKTLDEHRKLAAAAKEKGVLVCIGNNDFDDFYYCNFHDFRARKREKF